MVKGSLLFWLTELGAIGESVNNHEVVAFYCFTASFTDEGCTPNCYRFHETLRFVRQNPDMGLYLRKKYLQILPQVLYHKTLFLGRALSASW